MEIIHLRYCTKCKTKSGPLNKTVLKCNKHTPPRQYYNCRKCNTERMRKYRKTANGRERVRQAIYRSVKKHAKKQAARQAVHYALRTGKITKPQRCSVCFGRKKLSAYHNDFTQPLNVTWMCGDCYRESKLAKVS